LARGTPKRRWIKLYPIDCLEGSIRYQLEADERGVWYDLLQFSALCATPGFISDKDGRPYPHSFIANRLNISVDLLERTIDKCKEEGRISENTTGIKISNWAFYQSEYDRQKPYRQKKKDSEGNMLIAGHYFNKDWLEVLKEEFNDIDFATELKRFADYWTDGGRNLKNPKLALRNWMTKARDIKQKSEPESDDKPIQGLKIR